MAKIRDDLAKLELNEETERIKKHFFNTIKHLRYLDSTEKRSPLLLRPWALNIILYANYYMNLHFFDVLWWIIFCHWRRIMDYMLNVSKLIYLCHDVEKYYCCQEFTSSRFNEHTFILKIKMIHLVGAFCSKIPSVSGTCFISLPKRPKLA